MAQIQEFLVLKLYPFFELFLHLNLACLEFTYGMAKTAKLFLEKNKKENIMDFFFFLMLMSE